MISLITRLVILRQPTTGTIALNNALAPGASTTINSPRQLEYLQSKNFKRSFPRAMINVRVGLDRTRL